MTFRDLLNQDVKAKYKNADISFLKLMNRHKEVVGFYPMPNEEIPDWLMKEIEEHERS